MLERALRSADFVVAVRIGGEKRMPVRAEALEDGEGMVVARGNAEADVHGKKIGLASRLTHGDVVDVADENGQQKKNKRAENHAANDSC